MSAWIVYSKDGRTERCVLRSLEYGGTHMGERAVTATFDSPSEVAFEVFDYIEYRGEKFELEAVPTVKKTSDFNYEYELRFVSLKYELERCEMRDLVPNDNGVVYPTPLTFTFTGDVRYLVERIQACLDDLYGKGMWSIIVSDDVKSEEKNISIAQQNCWNALALVSTTYGLNFYVKGRTITIGGEQSLVGHTFEYGKGNGLYEIERAADTGTGIVTKLRAYGASRNLDYSYPKKPEWSDSVLPVSFALSPLRLMLPSFKTDGKTDYVLADDAMIAKYGIREASMVYDDIYPTITGATYNGQAIDEIKAVDEVDESKSTFTVYLHDLGFDLEEHLTTSDAQISMKTGTLQGYTFNISGIEKLSGGYKLTLGRNSLENSEESGAYVPSKNWNMAKGDKFVLLNILMPQAYIREAENRLLVRAKEYLAQYGKTNFSYNIGLHDKFLVEHPSVYGALVEGARLSVYDAELGISEDVTIQSITITENMEDNILPQVKVTLNNEPSASTLDRIQGKLNEVAAETAANNFSSQSELMAQYRKKLDKPFFEKLFVAIDKNGNEIATNDVTTPVAYILAKYDFASAGGVTMYAEGGVLNIPSIYNGLPIDNETLYWEEVNGSRVLKAKGGEGGGGLTEVYWDDVKLKPTFALVATSGKYADLSGLPDLSIYASKNEIPSLDGYATENWVIGKNYVDGVSLASELKKYVTIGGDETINGLKNFTKGLQIDGLGITKSQDDVIYLDANLVVRGGITMYAEGTVNIPSIIESIPTATNYRKGLASFDAEFFTVDINGHVKLIPENVGLNEEELGIYLTENKYATQDWITSKSYAKNDDLLFLKARIDDFLEGSDTDTIINKWKELESFLSGLSESDNLATILGTKANQSDLDDTNDVVATKWTQDDIKIGNWDTAYKWGDHSKVGYALKSYVDDTFVTIATKQPITGEKNFTGGLKVNGSPIVYDATNKYWKLEGDLLVTGGVTMFASDSAFTPSTIMDAIATDNVNLKVVDGVLTFVGQTGGGVADSVHWDNVDGKPTFATVATSGKYSDLSGVPTLLSSFIDDVVDGHYLPLSGGDVNGDLNIYGNPQSINKNGMMIFHNLSLNQGGVFKYKGGDKWTVSNSGGTTEYTILHSNNWSQFVTAGDGGNYLPLSGGTLNGTLSIGATISSDVGRATLGLVSVGDNPTDFKMGNGSQVWSITARNNAGRKNMWFYSYVSNNILIELDATFNAVRIGRGTESLIDYLDPEYSLDVVGPLRSNRGVFKSSSANILSLYRTESGGGAWIDYYAYNQTSSKWRVGAGGIYDFMWEAPDGNYPCRIHYNKSNGIRFEIGKDFTTTGIITDPSRATLTLISTSDNPTDLIMGANAYDWSITARGSYDDYLLGFYSNRNSQYVVQMYRNGNVLVTGGITMYSDIRKKTKLQDVELSLSQIANAPLIEHYYNSDEKRTTHVGSIAQYWASMNDWFCKLDSGGFYTMEIQNAALASAISIARELVKYESKTDRKIRLLKERVKELEDKIEKLENN